MSNNFASRLIQARTARGWSPDELAQKTGIDPEVVSRIENGKIRSGWRFPEIASALDVSLKWLATGMQEVSSVDLATENASADTESFASRLKATRMARGLSQQELADAADMSQTAIGHLEHGRNKRSRESAKLAAALGVNEGWLVTGQESASPSELQNAIPSTSTAKQRLLHAIKELSSEQIEQLIGIAEVLGQHTKNQPVKTAAHKPFHRRPLLFQNESTTKPAKDSSTIKKAS